MSFLSGLPALLGIAGFFAYLWAGQSKIAGEILKDIVGRLRTNPNLDLKNTDSNDLSGNSSPTLGGWD
jgi:hypothetical protein